MDELLLKLIRRFRPRIGWPQALLALSVALSPMLAAMDSKLKLPAGVFFWAGLLGLLIGLRGGRSAENREPRTDQRPTTNNQRQSRITHHASRITFYAALILGLGAFLLVMAGDALPPFGLVVQDLAAFFGWMVAAWRSEAGLEQLPVNRSGEFLAISLPRFWRALLAAPNAGEPGAQLLVAAGGVTTTWIGALMLGWSLVQRRPLLIWGLPMLLALALTAILGAGSGLMLVLGLALLLLLTITATFKRRELDWERRGADFSDELGHDVLMWGGPTVVLILALALLLPTSLHNPLTDWIWRDVELPSGIAVLERNIQRPQPRPKVDVGLSTLPVLELGQSLEQPPPEKIVLRVRVGAPLEPSPWPRYWRARILNLYTGRVWTTNARVGEFDTTLPVTNVLPGTLRQEIEDLRDDRRLVIGLPDIVTISVAANAERLPDGTLVALTEKSETTSYQVLSRPQELASTLSPEHEPPDMSGYLGLPSNLAPRVSDLARVVAGQNNPPAKQALALESYLRGLPYSYEVQPLPRSGEGVEQFLFDMRQGYCTYYASAMAIMARTLGIPARVSVGYATGEYDQASGAYVVREADAHAWPELYIDGRWTPFEPTPIRPVPARQVAPALPQPAEAAAGDEQPANASGPLIWAGVLATVVLLSLAGIWWRRRAATPLVAQVQLRLERLGARAGFPWPTGATLHEYGELLEPHAGEATSALHEVVDLVEVARYGGRELGADEQLRLRASEEHVSTWLRRRRRHK